MTTPTFDFEPAIKEALAAFECCRRLGFDSDDIYFAVPPKGKEKQFAFRVILRTQGKEWIYEAGLIEGRAEDFSVAMKKAVDLWNEGRNEQMMKVFRASKILANDAAFLMSLNKAGITWSKKKVSWN